MLIHGKERGFALTIGATIEIAEFCPNGDISRIADAITKGGYARQMTNICKLIVALNKGYEERRAFEEAGYTPDPLTENEVRTLTTADLAILQAEAMAAFNELPFAYEDAPAESEKLRKTASNTVLDIVAAQREWSMRAI